MELVDDEKHGQLALVDLGAPAGPGLGPQQRIAVKDLVAL